MWTAYLILTVLSLILTLLPKIQNSHWIFRVPEFGKIQITFIILFTFIFGFFAGDYVNLWYYQLLLLIMLIHHSVTLVKYTPLYPVKKYSRHGDSSQKIKFISANVYQFNKEYNRFINLIEKFQPDFFLTMESNSDWEKALQTLEKNTLIITR